MIKAKAWNRVLAGVYTYAAAYVRNVLRQALEVYPYQHLLTNKYRHGFLVDAMIDEKQAKIVLRILLVGDTAPYLKCSPSAIAHRGYRHSTYHIAQFSGEVH